MSISDRYNMTADVMAPTQVTDGKGGLKDSITARTTGVQFFKYKPKPFTVESAITRFGLEVDAVLYYMESEEIAAALIQNDDVLKVSSTEEYRVYSIEPVLGGDGAAQFWTLVVVQLRKLL